MTRKTSFYYSFLVLPAPERRAITAVFDFCRAVDDAVDLESDPGRATTALKMWRDEVARVFEARSPETPQGRALQPCVQFAHYAYIWDGASIVGWYENSQLRRI